MPPVMISPSARVPGTAAEPSRSRVGDGGGLGCLLKNMIGYRGFPRRRPFIGERATRRGGPVVQVGPRRGQSLGRAWVASGAVGPLQLPSWLRPSFIVKINHVNFQSISRNFPEQLFLKQKDNRKQELALGILLIG